MKKHSIQMLRKTLTSLLALVLGLTMISAPGSRTVTVEALDANNVSKVADPNTMDSWQTYFGSNTNMLEDGIISSGNAGYVWGDKTVLTTPTGTELEGLGITLDAQSNFLVAMSALAANKEIVGYSAIPTDTVLVLDLSNSMSDTALNNMITATNDAIRKLQELNRNNRVGVVVYSGISGRNSGYTYDSSVEVLLPIDRYTGVNQRVGQGQNATTVENFIQHRNGSFSVIDGVENDLGDEVSASMSAQGATYIQGGLWAAWGLYDDVEDTTVTDGVQEGTKRMPVLVLMSDGAPTLATSSYNNVGNPNRGNGTASSATDANAFLTSLTASWVRAKMEAKYERTGLVYTLGLGVDEDGVARSVLDPNNANETIKGYWNSYMSSNVANGATVQFGNGDNRFSVTKDTTITTSQYVDRYFSASDATGLINAFGQIVDTIILQSKYYPTLIEDAENELSGYITFTDELGTYMEVKDIKGILAGEGESRALYSGLAMAQAIFTQNTFGDISTGNMNNLNEAGQVFLDAVATRLGCTEDQAKSLIQTAITSDQISLSYNSETGEYDYSNYISWYADASGKYLTGWDGHTYETPTNVTGATYAVKSYGFLGLVGSEENYDASNMMHIVVQVRYDLATGHETVTFAIPAALIPMVTYHVSMEGTDYSNPGNIEMTIDENEPIRLVYEAGLRQDINELNVQELVEANYAHKNSDGTYSFYTNMYHHDENGNPVEGANPEEHDTTWLDFEPSQENERYYYTNDSLVLDSNHQPVKNIVSGQTYYHEFIVFNKVSATSDEAELVKYYPTVSASVLDYVEYNDEGYAYIPRGTVYGYLTTTSEEKTANPTGTLKYFNHLIVTAPSGTENYHIDAYLGNNGKLTLTPAQGIVLTKTLAAGVPTTDEEFTFEISATGSVALPSTYTLVHVNRAGIETKTSETVTGNKISVNLLSGEKAYIIGLPTGLEYQIIEVNDEDYVVESINGNDVTSVDGTVVANTLETYDFVNALRVKGNLSITKQVIYPEGFDGTNDPNEFTINVYLPQHVGQTLTLTNGETITIDTNGNSDDIKLKNGETIVITGLTMGDSYTVSEKDIPNGYTLNTTDSSLSGTIPEGTAAAVVVNNYTQEPVGTTENKSNISLNLNKEVSSVISHSWENVVFDFTLQYYDGTQWVDVTAYDKSVTINGTTMDGQTVDGSVSYLTTFDVISKDDVTTNSPTAFVFTEPGIYRYRIVEEKRGTVENGISYDAAENPFTIYVTDHDFDGKLEVNNVTYYEPMTLITSTTEGVTSYELIANFENTYSVTGTASVEIDLTKAFVNNTGIDVSLAGYVFELVDAADETTVIATSPATTDSGRTTIHLSYSLNGLSEHTSYNYILREVSGSEEGVEYSTEEISLTVYISHDGKGNGTASFKENEIKVSYGATFTNTYDLTDASATISGTKTLTGRDMNAGEFTFELYEADANFTIQGSAIDTVTNAAASDGEAGTFSFDAITYPTAGTYYYVVKEVVGDLRGVAYDTDYYNVTVTVSKGTGTTLTATVSAVGIGDNIDQNNIAFENTFVPLSMTAPVVIEGGKLLNSVAATEAGRFTFELYKVTDPDNYTLTGLTPIQTTNDEFGRFEFDPIVYNETELGEHYYVVVEKNRGENGYTYDEKEYVVTVTVSVDYTEGSETQYHIVASVTGGEDISFSNTYKPSPTEVTLEGNKKLTGDASHYTDNFTFNLYNATERFEIEGEAFDTVSVNKGKFTFDTITYEVPGTRYYVVTEDTTATVEGMTFDTSVYNVKVDVEDVNGNLVATVTVYDVDGNEADIEFTNDYDKPIIPTQIELTGTKVMLGRDMEAGEFTFLVHRTDETFTYSEPEALRVATNETAGQTSTFTFEPLVYDTEGVYYYTITEDTTADVTGMKYDTTQYNVTVTVEADANKQLVATAVYEVAGSEVDEVTFTNSWVEPTGDAVVQLTGKKTLNNEPATKAGQFTFLLYATDSTYTVPDDAQPIAATNDQNGNIVFDRLTYSEETVAYYVVVEDDSNPSKGMTYDSKEYRIKVTVTEDDYGNLQAVTEITVNGGEVDSIDFENTFVPLPMMTPVVIGGSKLLNGTAATETGRFTFELYEISDPDNYTLEGLTPIQTTNNTSDTFEFDPIEYDETELGKHYYVVVEKDRKETGYTYDDKEYVVTVEVSVDYTEGSETQYHIIATVTDGEAISFSNSYKPNSTKVTLEGNKVLTGDAILYTDDFTFNLYEADENYVVEGEAIDTVSVNKGTFTFDSITYETTGTRYYVVKEDTTATVEGMTFDTSVYNVKVDVEDVNGNLVATVTVYDVEGQETDIEFTNNYDKPIVPTQIELAGTKVMVGRDMEAGEFTFLVHETDETFAIGETEALRVATNETAGQTSTFTFETIAYDAEGVYYYTITEDTTPNEAGTKYDTTQYNVTVTVEANANKELVATVVYEVEGTEIEEVVFTNSWVEPTGDAIVQLIGMKKLNNAPATTTGEFTFLLYETDSTFTVPEGAEAMKATNDEHGNIVFDALTYSEPTEAYYVLVEDDSNPVKGMIYDSREYRIKVTVTEDEYNNLHYQTELTVEGAEVNTIIFENTVEVVETGDSTEIMPWVTTMGVALLTMVGLVATRKKEEFE